MSYAENLAPSVMASLAKQIRVLVKSPPDGVSLAPDEGSITEIHADITGPEETPFYGGKFRVKLVLGAEYPSKPPRGFFLTKIFHPNVAATGDICVNTLKRDWKPTLGLAHVLQIIRCLLIVPFPESSLNDEAGKMFMESYEEFKERAALMTRIHAMPKGGAGDSAAAGAGSTVATDASGGGGGSTLPLQAAMAGELKPGSGGKRVAPPSKAVDKKKKTAKKKALKRL